MKEILNFFDPNDRQKKRKSSKGKLGKNTFKQNYRKAL
jgi:hypothetical protein